MKGQLSGAWAFGRRWRASRSGRRGAVLAALTAFFMLTSMLTSVAAFAAVTTDQVDYAPGSVVTISGDNSDGAGYLDGETVAVDVSGPNGYTASCEGLADENGAWSCQVTLWDSLNAVGTYTYTASGLASGVTESGTFADNVNVAFGAGSLAWFRNTITGPPAGFDVPSISGTYTCNTTGANDCSGSPFIRVEIFPSDGTNNQVTGSRIGFHDVSVAASSANNASWSTGILGFRTDADITGNTDGQFKIADGKYDIRATLNGTFDPACTTACVAFSDDRIGIDNTAPSVAITALVDTGVDVSGTASDATSGIKNNKVDLNLYKDGGATPVFTSDAPVQGNGTWSKNGITKPTDPGTYCFVASLEDVAGNTAATTSATSGAHCFTVIATPTNDVPEVAFTSPPTEADEGTATTFNFSIDDDDADTWMFVSGYPDCGTGTASAASIDSTAKTGTFKCTFPDGPASETVKVKVFDGTANSNEASTAVSVLNVAPTVAAPLFSTTSVDCRTEITLSNISWTDPAGALDQPFSVTIEWGDGSSDTFSNVSAFSLLPKTHTYNSPGGPYTATVRVTDKDGDEGSNTSSNQITITQEYTVAFLPPFDVSNASLAVINKAKAGRVVPVKVTIFDVCADEYLTDGDPLPYIGVSEATTPNGSETDGLEAYADAGSANTDDKYFRWSTDGFWTYNLDTRKILNNFTNPLVTGKSYRINVFDNAGVKATDDEWALLKCVK